MAYEHDAFPSDYSFAAASRGYEIKRLAGRCTDGAERDCGVKWHAIKQGSWIAMCGAKPGRRSAGWSDVKWSTPTGVAGDTVTCPRCLNKIQKTEKL